MEIKLTAALLLYLVIVATPFQAFGQSAPEGFRDLKWGASQAEVKQAFRSARCEPSSDERADWRCSLPAESVNDVVVDVELEGYDIGSILGFTGFSLSFRPDDLPRILKAFESLYGPWTRVQKGEVVDKGRKRYPSATWYWTFPKVSIGVLQQAKTLTRSLAMIRLNAGNEEYFARQMLRIGGARKGP